MEIIWKWKNALLTSKILAKMDMKLYGNHMEMEQGRILGIRCASPASERKRSGRTHGRTAGQMDGQTYGRMNGWTDPLIEMRGHI